MGRVDDDFVPVTGGIGLGDDRVRGDLDGLHDLRTDSELDLHIARLLSLHSKLRPGIRDQDLTNLDIGAKRALLMEINELLGIKRVGSRRTS